MGLVVLGFGIYALVNGADFIQLIEESYTDDLFDVTLFVTPIRIFNFVTVFLVFWTFYGFISAFNESKCMLGSYIVMMLVIFLLLFIDAILCYVQSLDQLQLALERTMINYMSINSTNKPMNQSANTVKNAWDGVQENVSL